VSDQSRLLARAAVPDESTLYFGADPSWTPAREGLPTPPPPGPVKKGRRARRAARAAPDRTPRVDAENCPVCGGRNAPCGPADPIRDYETLLVACGTCMRTAARYEGRLKGRLDPNPVPPEENPAPRAGRVAGKPDPRLNPYLARPAAPAPPARPTTEARP
jgi:hypothetical protein